MSDKNSTAASRPTKLYFFMRMGLLQGVVNGKAFATFAWSGGGGGSTNTTKGYVNDNVVNNPAYETRQTSGSKTHHVHGGPIPEGHYKIQPPAHRAHLGYSAELVPTAETKKYLTQIHRGGFFIHGRGPHGSDGCIVPRSYAKLRELLDAMGKHGGDLFVFADFADLSLC